MSKRERLQEFAKRLSRASPVASVSEAKKLIDTTLNTVEDEFSGVPYDPHTAGADGRMYPAQADSRRDVPGRSDLVRYRHRFDETYIRANGAFMIRSTVDGAVLVDVPGADGEYCEIE